MKLQIRQYEFDANQLEVHDKNVLLFRYSVPEPSNGFVLKVKFFYNERTTAQAWAQKQFDYEKSFNEKETELFFKKLNLSSDRVLFAHNLLNLLLSMHQAISLSQQSEEKKLPNFDSMMQEFKDSLTFKNYHNLGLS